ncbi:MAG: hypothetical protein R3B93_15505 [Bacteroidia bacterium]
MKHFTYLFLVAVLIPSWAFAQKLNSQPKNAIGISLRPSIYKNYFQFEDHQMFDLAPAIHFERRLNSMLSIE